VFSLLCCPPAGAQTASVDVIPAPLRVDIPAGQSPVAIADGAAVVAGRGDTEALDVARYFADVVQRTRGLRLVPQAGAKSHGAVIVLQRRRGMASEGYALDIGHGRAVVSASTSAGLLYGAVTLWQLMSPDAGNGPVTLAPIRIEDTPRFAWRGLMLDSARHFWTQAEVERLIDVMALHKLNVLHWHLTDDQGWRLQIMKYPRLTEVGAWRAPIPGSPDAERDPASGRNRPYGGFYTQAQVREIVAYAGRRHVTIVPELDMPGHAVSALLAYPALGSGAPPPARVQAEWGGFPYLYNLDDQTLGFVEDVLSEVMALFPGRYIHVGGDEAVKERWNDTPEVQARMKALGISDVTQAQAWFTGRMAQFLAAHGRRLVGWDEILQGGAPPADAVVMSWHGPDGAAAAAAAGHDAVLAAAPVLYFDNRQGEGPDEPPGRGNLVTLKDVYAFDPTPAAMPADAAAHILGLQGNLWTEHIRTFAQIQAMAFPRMAAVAETAWSAPAQKSWPGFVRRLPAQFARYDAIGFKADPAALTVRIDPDQGAQPATAMVALTSQASDIGEIRYTTDGSDPVPASALYQTPFAAPASSEVRAGLFIDGRLASPIAARKLEADRVLHRSSQQLKLCNDRLGLNLEGGGPDPRPVYLINPLDACWTWPGAALDGVSSVTVGIGRLPFIYGLDQAHNTVIAHPPREPSGEIEVHQDGCLTEPIAVAELPAGDVGTRSEMTLQLPARTGRHDLCFTFTSERYDPILALDWVQLHAGAAP
jgi:hexosaminidase